MATYRDYVRRQSALSPCLTDLVRYLDRESHQPSKIVCLDYTDGHAPAEPVTVASDDELLRLLSTPPPASGRVLLVEDVEPRLVSLIGGSLDVDPLFFAGHISTEFANLENGPAPPNNALLPSQLVGRDYIHLNYQQVLDLGSVDAAADASKSPYFSSSAGNVARSMRRLPILSSHRQLCLKRACCSVLVKVVSDSWISIVLVDQPSPAKPLYGGFEDVVPPQPFSAFRAAVNDGRNNNNTYRGSMLASLVHHLREPVDGSLHDDKYRLAALCRFPLRIVLAEWNTYVLLTGRFLKHYEYAPSGAHGRLGRDRDRDLVDLQRWRRRNKQSQYRLSLLAAFLNGVGEEASSLRAVTEAASDVQHLRVQLDQFGAALEQMIALALSMVQLLDAKRSSQDSASVMRLTLIALVFVPVSTVASLFSMTDEYAPGGARFWVYVVSAVVVLAVVLILSILSMFNQTLWLRIKGQLARKEAIQDMKKGTWKTDKSGEVANMGETGDAKEKKLDILALLTRA